MALDCYDTPRGCTPCAKNRIEVRRHSTYMKVFPATTPLEFLSIGILGELIRTPRGNRYLLVFTYMLTKMVRTVPLKTITSTTVARAFVYHWISIYGPPKTVLSDSRSQFMARFLQEMSQIIGSKNLDTTTYSQEFNGLVERSNLTIIATVRRYIGDHPHRWDLFTGPLSYAYNTKVHTSTKISPLQMVLSEAPTYLSLEERLTSEDIFGKRFLSYMVR